MQVLKQSQNKRGDKFHRAESEQLITGHWAVHSSDRINFLLMSIFGFISKIMGKFRVDSYNPLEILVLFFKLNQSRLDGLDSYGLR